MITTTSPQKERKITRIVPGHRAQYELVSMPEWAWVWLEDYMFLYNMDSFPELLSDFQDCIHPNQPLSEVLENIAAIHHHFMTQAAYDLENDNDPFSDTFPPVKRRKGAKHVQKDLKFPQVMQLFGFTAHATTLDAAMLRRMRNAFPAYD